MTDVSAPATGATSQVRRHGLDGSPGFVHRIRLAGQRGLTLIETALVLAILAVFVSGVIIYFTSADQSRKTTEAMSQLASIQQAVRSIYGGQSTFTGLTSAVIVNTNALPQRMVSGTTIRHAFNGLVTVEPAAAGGGANSGFSITYENVPKDPCVKMVSSDLGRGLFSVTAGSVTRSQTSTPPPFDPAAAATACASASSNTIEWVFN